MRANMIMQISTLSGSNGDEKREVLELLSLENRQRRRGIFPLRNKTEQEIKRLLLRLLGDLNSVEKISTEQVVSS